MQKRKNNDKSLFFASALFIVLMGIISMMIDMTHEGAKSIYGNFLNIVGATPKIISLISGLGEFIGYSLIFVTGIIANKSKKYWTMTIIGYMINLLAIPLLSLTWDNGWQFACMLILLERLGKAIRKPAKSTLVSFSSKNIGEGKSFAFVEFLDQIGAFIGPLILTIVLYIKGTSNLLNTYKTCLLILGIPAVVTLIILLIAKHKYPNPENLETAEEIQEKSKIEFNKDFVFYLIAIGLCGFSFIDFPLIEYHIETLNIIKIENLPTLYSLAMLVDAFSALLFGVLFDKLGIKTLAISTILSMLSPLFIFNFSQKIFIYIGVILWGVGMGSQESILKSAVAKLIKKENRALGFGIFEGLFGLSWLLGSFVLGILYENSTLWMIIISIGLQFLAVPFYLLSDYKKQIN